VNGSGTKILIVDDEESLRSLIEIYLSNNNYEVISASNGREALEKIDRDKPEIIVSDIMMPEMDGYELLGILKGSAEYSDIPVIMLTSMDEDMDKIHGLSAGADDYMTKPFNMEELLLRIEKLLFLKRRIAGAEYRFTESQKLLDLTKEELLKAHKQLKKIMLESLEGLVTALEARDKYTRGHSERVAAYAGGIAREMNLDNIDTIIIAARLHDIGKIGVRDNILYKGEKLTKEEKAIIEAHPVKGAEIIGKISFLRDIVPAVKYHHERYDGTGFPEGLRGDEIPLAAKIIAVADTFDAITTDRPYRKGLDFDHALSELQGNAGTQFDPVVIEYFLKILNTK